MELAVVSPPDYFEGEAALINDFFNAGLPLLHLRKPENNAVKFMQLMAGIDPQYYPQIAVHQHHDLAAGLALERLHFTEEQRKLKSPAELQQLAGDFRLSSSIHELSLLNGLTDFDYVFFGPVFNSISKKGYHSILPADFVLPAHTTKVYAIGGIMADLLAQLKIMNFDGAAVLGSIWHQQVSPLAAFAALQQAIKLYS